MRGARDRSAEPLRATWQACHDPGGEALPWGDERVAKQACGVTQNAWGCGVEDGAERVIPKNA